MLIKIIDLYKNRLGNWANCRCYFCDKDLLDLLTLLNERRNQFSFLTSIIFSPLSSRQERPCREEEEDPVCDMSFTECTPELEPKESKSSLKCSVSKNLFGTFDDLSSDEDIFWVVKRARLLFIFRSKTPQKSCLLNAATFCHLKFKMNCHRT